MKTVVVVSVVIVLAMLGCFIGNVIKLVGCDFEAPYKCEAVHAVGLIAAPLSLITVWYNDK